LCHINGDILDFNISNLEFKPINHRSNPFEAQHFCEDGKIISKICCSCGVKRDIHYFQEVKSSNGRHSIRNSCRFCETKLSMKSFNKKMSDPSFYKLYRANRREYDKAQTEKITALHIAGMWGASVRDITPEILDLCRKKILLQRRLRLIRAQKKDLIT
jgi:hypothetical protein